RMGGLGVLGDVGRDRCGFPEGVPEDPGARVGAVADDAQAGVAGGHHHRVVAVGHCVGGGGGVGEAGAEDGQDVVVGDQRGGGRRRCGGHRVVVADGENDLGALHPTGGVDAAGGELGGLDGLEAVGGAGAGAGVDGAEVDDVA